MLRHGLARRRSDKGGECRKIEGVLPVATCAAYIHHRLIERNFEAKLQHGIAEPLELVHGDTPHHVHRHECRRLACVEFS